LSTTRGARAGQTITLRARFKDDLEENAQAQNVYVHIFEPDTTDFDLSNAVEVSGVAQYFGEGIFEYDYVIPSCGPDGMWYDSWQGDLTCQALSGLFTFEVAASGIVRQLPSQLVNNSVVRVILPSGLQASDGTELAEEFEFEFMTTTSPAYSNTRKVRLEVGGYVKGLYDDVIQTAILEASLEADVLTFYTETQNTSVYQHARREYVTCLASSILLQNISSGSLKTKTLADLHVEYDTGAIRDAMNTLRECMGRWEPQILAGGLAKATAQPAYVIKGEYDPDRPASSRMWQSTDTGGISRRMPAANTRERNTGQRRYLRTYTKRYW
jgi:hypothetical protein